MSITFAENLPESLLKRLYASERKSSGTSALQPGDRDQALDWLRRALVEFDSLDQHIAFLQKLSGLSFQYPRPRRDAWNLPQPVKPSTEATFTQASKLEDELIAEILDRGVDCLSDNDLTRLMLNPLALFDLFDCIDDIQPDYWIDIIHDFVATHRHSRQIGHAQASHANGRGDNSFPLPKPHSTPDGDFWSRLTETLAASIKEARSSSTPSDEPLATKDYKSLPVGLRRTSEFERTYSPWNVRLNYVFALAAILAVFFFAWSTFQLSNAVKVIPEQITAFYNESSGSHNTAGPGSGIALTSARGDLLTLEDCYRFGSLEPKLYTQNPNKYLADISSAAEPALKALIETKQQQGDSDLALLEYLRSLVHIKSTDDK